MRKFLKDYKKDFKYTWRHKKAILKLEKQILGKNTIQGYLHDTDKLFLYLLFTKKETSRLHRKYSKHHQGNHKTKADVVNAVLDWESARMTKPDKPETAREYLEKAIPHLKYIYIPVMEELGI